MTEDEFRRMVEAEALSHASEFIAEETAMVADVVAGLANPGDHAMIVVGGAGSSHLANSAQALGRCIVVDPLGLNRWTMLTRFVSTVHLRALHEIVRSELPDTPLVWVFTFNVFPYLTDPIAALRRLAAPGDTVIVTAWADGDHAKRVRKGYLRYVFGSNEPIVKPVADIDDIAEAVAHDRPGAQVKSLRGEVVSAAVVHLAVSG